MYLPARKLVVGRGTGCFTQQCHPAGTLARLRWETREENWCRDSVIRALHAPAVGTSIAEGALERKRFVTTVRALVGISYVWWHSPIGSGW